MAQKQSWKSRDEQRIGLMKKTEQERDTKRKKMLRGFPTVLFCHKQTCNKHFIA
jgi:hypothetical protein